MGSIQFPEIAVILLVALLLFGPKRLPEIGRTIGTTMRELRKVARDFSSSIEEIGSDVRSEVKDVESTVSSGVTVQDSDTDPDWKEGND